MTKKTNWDFKAKTPEIFETRVRQAYADYYRHAETHESMSTLMRIACDYGVSMAECFNLCQFYNSEMREFYRDSKTVAALMACNS